MTDTVLVTGSSRGIGKATALRLAREGYAVVLHCRSQRDAADAIAERIAADGGTARVLQFDIADRVQCKTVLEADIAEHGCYYGVVCSAGITADTAFPAMDGDSWDRVLRTNLDGFYNVLQPLVMPMVRRRKPGRVVVLSSVSGEMGNRGQTNYAASKAGLIGAAKSLALELAKRKITVNCVAPGLIDTDMTEDVTSSEHADMIKNMIPLRRIGTADEVAGTINFLLSEDAAYITRQVIGVNGGLH